MGRCDECFTYRCEGLQAAGQRRTGWVHDMSWKKVHAEELYRPFVNMALRHPFVVIGMAVLGVVLSLLLSATRLEFHTSHLDLVSSGNRYKQLDQAFSREFDDIPERVIVVIRGQDKNRAKAFATALAQRLEGEPSIEKVLYRIPLDALQDKALLFLSDEELTELQRQLEQHQELFNEFAASSDAGAAVSSHQS